MRVIVAGKENGVQKTYTYDLLDRYDAATKTSSMARTTGYTCTGAARLILENKFTRKGVSTPEFVGEDENNFHDMLNYLKARNIHYKLTIA
jgi:saccharopine dehydrogenase-like NADP-dependent oxidoreductase